MNKMNKFKLDKNRKMGSNTEHAKKPIVHGVLLRMVISI